MLIHGHETAPLKNLKPPNRLRWIVLDYDAGSLKKAVWPHSDRTVLHPGMMLFPAGRIPACEPLSPGEPRKLTLADQLFNPGRQRRRFGSRPKPRHDPPVAPDEEFREIPSDAVAQQKTEPSRPLPVQETE